MKKISTLLVCMMVYFSYGQNVGIGTKDPKNKLHVAGGLRVDSLAAKKDSGLILHNTNGDVYSLPLTGKKSDVLRGDGSFAMAAAPTDAWLLGGNSGTDSLTNYLGTNDNKPLMFRVAGLDYGRFSSRNLSIGKGALNSQYEEFFEGSQNIALGTEALGRVFGSKNIGIGQFTLRNLTGQSNIAIGAYALFGSSTSTGQMGYGDDNIAIGEASLSVLHSGSGNIAIGQRALAGRDPGIGGGWAMEARDNVAIGTETMLDFAGVSNEGQPSQGNNTAIGTYSQRRNQAASYNTSIGQGSLHNNTLGNYNTASGSQSLFHSTGSYNTATGFKSLFSNTAGGNNTGTGFKALNFNTTGAQNSGFGFEALNTNTTGGNNTAIGYRADVSSGALTNATAVGYMAKVNASNKVRIGNAAVTVIEGQVPFTTPSDGRFKYNVKEDVGGLDFIMKLRPVTYQFDVKKFDHISQTSFASNKSDGYDEAAKIRRTGFIAQEVEEAAAETHYNFSGIVKPQNENEHYSLSYESFVVPLVKAVQDQQQLIRQQQKQILEQGQQMKMQQQQIDMLLKKAGLQSQ